MVQFGRPSLVHFRRHIPVQLRPSLDRFIKDRAE